MSKVLKFGGTSVGSASNIKRAVEILLREKSTVTVLSAMSGTTDSLVKLCEASRENSAAEIDRIIDSLHEKYSSTIKELLPHTGDEGLCRLWRMVRRLKEETNNYDENYSSRRIVAEGEMITSAIFTMYLRELGHKAILLEAPEYIAKSPEGKVCQTLIREYLQEHASDPDTLYVTQGFVCMGSDGRIDNLGRGGSDYSAALIGSAIDADEVQIWTDIDGMHNNDPRFVDNTRPIPNLHYEEAAELAYFGAKILHPATIQPCKDKGIPVLLKNTLEPAAAGTAITGGDDPSVTYRAVAAKDGIIVIRIHSARMLMAYGFLRQVFEIFEKYRTPIDMITTSEVSVSLTIDSDRHLNEIVSELQELGTISIERDNTIVCVVGNIEHDKCGLAEGILAGVRDIPLKMISYGATHRSISMLVYTEHKVEFLRRLNDTLFSEDD